MEEKNKKELIEVIKSQLRKIDEVPYKEGAWENFQAKYADKKPSRRLFPIYWGAAAAVLLVCGLLYIQNQKYSTSLGTAQHTTLSQQDNSTSIPQPMEDEPVIIEQYTQQTEQHKTIEENILARVEQQGSGETKNLLNVQELASYATIETLNPVYTLSLSAQQLPIEKPVLEIPKVKAMPLSVVDLGGQMTMAQQADPKYAHTAEAGRQLSPKRLKIGDKLELGIFLSPSLTQDNFEIGGGLVLGYQLNDKLTLRTGASLHQYELGILASDLKGKQASSSADLAARQTDALAAQGIPYQMTNVLLPNLNAVTGKVQTLDIPLELKYNVSKQFYATAGVSYAAVLAQERYNHYKEYSNPLAYSSEAEGGAPSKEGQEVMDRKTKSSESNVNTNGFGGFINFSIGRKTPISRKLNLSIEPFVKVPIGQFERADMNYTNGGIRIMTNF